MIDHNIELNSLKILLAILDGKHIYIFKYLPFLLHIIILRRYVHSCLHMLLQVYYFFEIHIIILRNFAHSLFTYAYMCMKTHASRLFQFLELDF